MGSLPDLNHDVTAEILLRVAPDEPGVLFRASVVCKLWHRILYDPDFCRRYRAFHQGARLLGLFYNNLDIPRTSSPGLDFPPAPTSRFVATTPASLLPAATRGGDRHVSWALDCRHGRVLYQKAGSRGLAVWDPIADEWTDVPPPSVQYASYSAVLLCDVAGCDHTDCRGGRFLVACIGLDRSHLIYACVYSSEDRAWQAPVSSHRSRSRRFGMNRPTVVGDGIYYAIGGCDGILKYNFVRRCFSWIGMPCKYKRDPLLMQHEDRSLGLATIRGSTLFLWSRRSDNYSSMWKELTPRKVFCVDKKQCANANLIGFTEGVGVFIFSTSAGVFTLELKSMRVTKVSNPSMMKYQSVVPFISFFARNVL